MVSILAVSRLRAHVIVLLVLAGSTAVAQKNAPVYRCQTGSKVEYSNEPCIDARVVDTTPTRGLDKDGGQPRKGVDVQREEIHEAMAEGIKPLTGLNALQLEKFGYRRRLDPSVQKECQALDTQLVLLERSARGAPDGERSRAEASLFVARNRYRALRC